MSFGDVILNYGDSLIRESEMTILQSNQWLNDAVISFYFEYLSNQSKFQDTMIFYGPAVSQLLKLTESEEVSSILGENVDNVQYGLWPVNDSSDTEKPSSGSHWSLLVFSRPDNKFLHFDSYASSNADSAHKLYLKLKNHFGPTSSFQNFDECCAQENGRDCGLHVLLNAELILRFVHEASGESRQFPRLLKNGLHTATPQQVAKMRPQLLKLIQQLGAQS